MANSRNSNLDFHQLIINELTFYEILVDGNAKLLKKVSKKIMESRAYNSATTVKNIVDNTNYYIFEDDKLLPVKKDKKSLIAAVSKKDKIQNYFAEKENSIKKEEDLVKADIICRDTFVILIFTTSISRIRC